MKDTIRKSALKKRKLLSCEEKDKHILENLFKVEEYIKAKNVLIYYPLKYEINVLPCLNDKNKTFYLPRVNPSLSVLEICKYDENNLKTGCFGIKEPCNEELTDLSIIDVVITPAVAVDKQGYRLGYGKGFYDRLFSTPGFNPVKIVLIYKNLIFDDIYKEEHDKKVDITVSENFVYRF